MKTSCLILIPPMFQSGNLLMPRGGLSIASYLNHQGISAGLFPLNALPSPAFVPGFNDLNYIAEILEPALQDSKPRIIGLSCPYSYLYPLSLKILKVAKNLAPGALTVIGGPHVTYKDADCLEKNPWVDVVVRGEGEWTMAALCTAVARREALDKIRGISFRRKEAGPGSETILRTENRPTGNLSMLPALDFSLLPQDYVSSMRAYGILSRGCAYRCAFCQESRFWQGKVRRYHVASFVREFSELYYKYDNQMVSIDDSMLSMKSRTWFELIESLRESGVALHENFSVVTRADAVTREGVEAMRDSGIKTILMGVETASPKVAARMNKNLDLSTVIRAATLARRKNINVSTFWIIGHPGDDPEEAKISFDFLCSLYHRDLTTGSDPAMFIPYPGTVFYRDPDRYGLEILNQDSEQWIRGNRPVVRLRNFSEDDILLWYKKFFDLTSYRKKLTHNLMKRADGLMIVPARIEDLSTGDKAEAWHEAIHTIFPEKRVTVYCRNNTVTLDFSPDMGMETIRNASPADLLEKTGLAVKPSETADFGLPWFRSEEMSGEILTRFVCHGLLRVIPSLKKNSE